MKLLLIKLVQYKRPPLDILACNCPTSCLLMQHEVWPYVKMSLIINHITINGISYIKRGSLYLPLYSNSVSKILMENFYIETFFFFFFCFLIKFSDFYLSTLQNNSCRKKVPQSMKPTHPKSPLRYWSRTEITAACQSQKISTLFPIIHLSCRVHKFNFSSIYVLSAYI